MSKELEFINSPTTLEQCENNANVQLRNVEGWFFVIVKDYQCALIYAKYLVDALECLIDKFPDEEME